MGLLDTHGQTGDGKRTRHSSGGQPEMAAVIDVAIRDGLIPIHNIGSVHLYRLHANGILGHRKLSF